MKTAVLSKEALPATREEVIACGLEARTKEEIARARALLREWMHNHPEDTTIGYVGEALALREDA